MKIFLQQALAGLLAAAVFACSPEAIGDCTLTFDHIATLKPPGDPGFGDHASVSGPLPSGLWAVTRAGASEVLLFDFSGEFVDSLGGIGAGPGEFRRPQHVLAYRVDSILVLDRDNARASVFNLGRRLIRSFPVSFPGVFATSLTDGSIVLAHGVSIAGNRVARFDTEGQLVSGEPFDFRRGGGDVSPLLQPGALPDGGWWTLSLEKRFEFSRFDARDSLLSTWEFPHELLPPYSESQGQSPDTPPQARIGSAAVDTLGRLWTLGIVADSQWFEGLGPAEQDRGGTYYPTVDRHAVYDALVMLSDIKSGEVLASWRLDSLPGYPVASGHIVRTSEDEDGWHRIELLRLRPGDSCHLD